MARHFTVDELVSFVELHKLDRIIDDIKKFNQSIKGEHNKIDTKLIEKLSQINIPVDVFVDIINGGQSSLKVFKLDKTLFTRLADIRSEVAEIRDQLNEKYDIDNYNPNYGGLNEYASSFAGRYFSDVRYFVREYICDELISYDYNINYYYETSGKLTFKSDILLTIPSIIIRSN